MATGDKLVNLDVLKNTVQKEVVDLKSAVNSTALIKKSTSFGLGTSTAKDKRLLLNVDDPIPSGAKIGALYMVADRASVSTSYRLELATLSDGTYTVYDSISTTIEMTSETGKVEYLFDVNKTAVGDTYLFVTLSASYMFSVASATGKKMYIGDDISSASFTTRTVNNYEIDYMIYYGITDTVFDALSDVADLPDVVDAVAGDVETLQADVTTLQNDVASCLSFGKIVEKTIFNTTDDPTTVSPFAKTRRWFINHVFAPGVEFNKIDFCHDKSETNTRTVYVELWENESGTLTKVKSVAVDVTASETVSDTVFVASATMNYTVENPCMVAFCLDYTGSNGALLYTTDETYQNRILTSSDVTPATNSLSYSSLSEFTTVNINPAIKIHYSGRATNVITIGPDMDYPEIQDALDAIADDTPDNPYTFMITPKAVPYGRFSMTRKLTETYAYTARVRNISLIGMDKAHCVIQSDTGDYATPPGEPLTNGIIANLTFKMTNDKQSETAEKGGYCLHIDTAPLTGTNYKMVIENCDFENASGPCLGIGLRKDCELTIKNCNMHTTLSSSYAPSNDYRNLYTYGVLFAHTDSGASTTGQHINIIDCVGICEEGAKSLNLIHTGDYSQATAEFEYTLLRNVFWNNSANAPAYNIDSDLTASPYNFGNNIT